MIYTTLQCDGPSCGTNITTTAPIDAAIDIHGWIKWEGVAYNKIAHTRFLTQRVYCSTLCQNAREAEDRRTVQREMARR